MERKRKRNQRRKIEVTDLHFNYCYDFLSMLVVTKITLGKNEEQPLTCGEKQSKFISQDMVQNVHTKRSY